MSPIDLLLITIGIGLALFLAYQRMARALFALGVLWVVSLISGLLTELASPRLATITGVPLTIVAGLMSIVFFVIFFAIGYALIAVSFPDTRLPKIGALDVLMGLLLGIIVAAIFVALLQNAVGLMVSQQWADVRQWNVWRSYYARSPLLPILQTLLRLWRQLLAPFFRTLPPVLTPQ